LRSFIIDIATDGIIAKVSQILPNLTPEVLQNVRKTLEDHGVKSWDDVGLLEPENLIPPLKTIQCRKLLQNVQGNYISNQFFFT
jgi:hypothetical protein